MQAAEQSWRVLLSHADQRKDGVQSWAWTGQAFAAGHACAYAEARFLLADAALQGSWLQHLGGDGACLLKAAERVKAQR